MTEARSDKPSSRRERQLIDAALGEAFDGARGEVSPTVPVPPAADAVKESGRDPEHVGPYRIIRRIGRGGMGVVYLAVRDGDLFKRRVAVKVLGRGADTHEILERFEQERQVLAALNHPGIARLFDAGETEVGLPFFAMEYVEGQPIDEYCDTHQLRIAERLALFRQVCGAVHYVHQNLMVHRDLKPSNVLVTGDGVAKLLDFGIAKLINPEMSLFGGDPTAVERSIMTPEYASPEQVRGNPVGVASDIYSLGVILYELLTGHRPYHLKSRVRAELERVICEVDPERPSSAATRIEVIEHTSGKPGTTTTITPESVAKVREGRPDRLRRRLAGDLDNIVLMAMRKAPQRRYQSVQQFGEDLGRHLDGLPVVARRDTAGYRFAKFTSRHRWGVAAAAAVVIALTGWGVTAGYLLVAESQHGKALAEQSKQTRQALMALVELADGVGLFDESVASDNTLSARKSLAETVQKSLEDLRPYVADDPMLRSTLADAYDTVGDIWGGHRGETIGDTTIALGNYRHALAMRQTLAASTPQDPDLKHDVAVSHMRIGDALRFTGDVVGAHEAYRTYLDIVERLSQQHTRFRRPFAIALGAVGTAHKKMGNLKQAQDYYDRSLTVRKGLHAEQPDNTPAIRDVGVGLMHAGEALALLGDRDGALAMYVESIVLREALVRAEPDNSRNLRYLALSHYFAADMLLKLDRPNEAATHVETAGPIFLRRAEENPDSAQSKVGLVMAAEIRGRLAAARGDHDAALKSYGSYQAVILGLLQRDPVNTFYGALLADSHERIGDSYHELDELRAADRAYRQAHAIVRPLAEADPSDVDLQLQLGRILSALGSLLTETGELREAQGRLDDARSIQETIFQKVPDNARAREGLVVTLRRLSRWADERDYVQEALDYAREAMRVAGRADAAVLRDLAAAQALNGDTSQAVETVQQAIALLANSTGPAAGALREALRQDLVSYRSSSE